jgi:hypothetical protein
LGGGVTLFAAISLSACEPTESEELDTALQPLAVLQTIQGISDFDKVPGKSPNVASSNGEYRPNAVDWMSDVVIGYEKGVGNALWAWSHDNGSTWTKPAANTWPLPASQPSDDRSAFRAYEGSPVPVSFHQVQSPSMPKSRHFVMVSMVGTADHGLSLNNGTLATDIVGLVSSDGGETFSAPVVLNNTIGGSGDPVYTHAGISFVTAAPEMADGFATGYVQVFWRQVKFLRNPCGTCAATETEWFSRKILMRQTGVPGVFDIETFPSQSRADYIPSNVDEVSVASNGNHLYVAYASVPNTGFTCPSTATANVTWRVRDLFYSSTYSAAVPANDTTWRRCVGASSVSGGTPHNRAVGRPGLAVNPVTGELFVAVSKKFSSTDTHSRIQVRRTMPTSHPSSWSWLTRYDSPRLVLGTATPLAKDAWMPVISAFQYPGETDGYVGLNFVTTQYDTTGNNRVRQAGWTWRVGDPLPVAQLIDGGSATGGVSVEQGLGAFNGLVALPRYDGGFLSAWGDQRENETHVWSARMLWFP